MVEDIHWADAWTLERLAALALLAARQPLLLVMTTRFAGDPTAGAWRTVLHGAPLIGIDLAPLNAEEARRLATQASSMPAAIVASCVERAEGNPLFLLQLLLNAGEAAQSSLPGSIQALVHARMDRLASDDKIAPAVRRRPRPAVRHRCAAPSARQPGLRQPAAGREFPRPSRRQRAHVLPRAHPRRRLRIAAAQATPPPAWPGRRVVRVARPRARRRALRPCRGPARRGGLPGGGQLGRGAVPPRGGARPDRARPRPRRDARDPLRAAHGARPPDARAGPLRGSDRGVSRARSRRRPPRARGRRR